MTNPTPELVSQQLDIALAEYTTGIDHAVRFVTIDQVDMLAEFYLHNRTPTPAPNAGAVKVKPLTWCKVGPYGLHEACGLCLKCQIREGTDGGIRWQAGHMGIWFEAATIEAAKAAAQADYDARILSAIETTPDPRDEVIARLETERDEANRRRDAWKAKAEGFDAVRLALREKVGAPWPPSLSRVLWAGIAADEKARADAAEAVIARVVESLTDTSAILQAAMFAGKVKGADQYRIGGVYLQNVSDTLDASDAALAAAKEVMK